MPLPRLSGAGARAGLLLVSALFCALLIGVPAWSHLGVLGQLDALERGEGQFLLAEVRLTEPGLDPEDPATLQAAFTALQDRGLVWLALVSPDGVLAEAGAPVAPAEQLPNRETDFISFGTTARVGAPLGPPLRGEEGGEPRRGRRHEHPPQLVLEYVPREALNLALRSRTALLSSCVGALLLTAVTAWLWWLGRRADAVEREMTRHQHLASLGQVSAVLAHEIRNPLAALKGHAQLLERKVGPAERERAGRVVYEAKRLEDLVNSLLDFARTAAVERELASPLVLLEQAAAATDPNRVQIDAAGAPARWPLDPRRVEQALVNLIDNALRASEGPVQASAREVDGALVFVVRDHGAGVPAAQLDQIFEPFFTTRTQGTGLGLAVVRRVAALHGGVVSAANPPDGGAELRLSIPRE